MVIIEDGKSFAAGSYFDRKISIWDMHYQNVGRIGNELKLTKIT